MKHKTSLYLDDIEVARLRRLAKQEGRSQAEVMRAALASYASPPKRTRTFAVEATGWGDGRSVADIPEDELLKGFGS